MNHDDVLPLKTKKRNLDNCKFYIKYLLETPLTVNVAILEILHEVKMIKMQQMY